jgi:hypothetical protein
MNIKTGDISKIGQCGEQVLYSQTRYAMTKALREKNADIPQRTKENLRI